jgi:hypothetical protein
MYEEQLSTLKGHPFMKRNNEQFQIDSLNYWYTEKLFEISEHIPSPSFNRSFKQEDFYYAWMFWELMDQLGGSEDGQAFLVSIGLTPVNGVLRNAPLHDSYKTPIKNWNREAITLAHKWLFGEEEGFQWKQKLERYVNDKNNKDKKKNAKHAFDEFKRIALINYIVRAAHLLFAPTPLQEEQREEAQATVQIENAAPQELSQKNKKRSKNPTEKPQRKAPFWQAENKGDETLNLDASSQNKEDENQSDNESEAQLSITDLLKKSKSSLNAQEKEQAKQLWDRIWQKGITLNEAKVLRKIYKESGSKLRAAWRDLTLKEKTILTKAINLSPSGRATAIKEETASDIFLLTLLEKKSSLDEEDKKKVETLWDKVAHDGITDSQAKIMKKYWDSSKMTDEMRNSILNDKELNDGQKKILEIAVKSQAIPASKTYLLLNPGGLVVYNSSDSDEEDVENNKSNPNEKESENSDNPRPLKKKN